MARETQLRAAAVVLALCTVAVIVFGIINFQKERDFLVPDDGIWWLENAGHLYAQRVNSGGPGERAGIKAGDVLAEINGQPIHSAAGIERSLFQTGIYSSATYGVIRHGVRVEAPLILVPADKSLNLGLRLIALIYLGIGVYVLLRRWSAPKSTHFFVFCLVSFVYYAFHYTGKLNTFDEIILWSSIVASVLQPALFLHFALTFPEPKDWIRQRRWLLPVVYVPGALVLAAYIVAVNVFDASKRLLWNLDRIDTISLAVGFLLAAWVLFDSYRKAKTPLLRQQMKWVTRGTLLAIVPFTLFYVIPFVRGAEPSTLMKASVLALVFLPLTFGYAIVRYRLMDVDLIFKRGMAYTLATAIITLLNLLIIGVVVEKVHTKMPNAGEWGLIAAVVITALLFDPVRKLIQGRLDRLFYRQRYDYRRTLIDFARDLNSETDLRAMLSAVVDRLSHTLLVDRVAVFLATESGEAAERFFLAKSVGIASGSNLELEFLGRIANPGSARHLFFDNTQHVLNASPAAQATIAQLDLNYYIPCRVQNRMIAVLGMGKTADGDYLSSEDVELLETLSAYIGIAIQNARLYSSLQQRIAAYERLKEFNENIVESISVGVLAVDLEDRVESWNSQMEVMYATPRAQALGRSLSGIFPAAFVEEYYRVRQSPGIHNFYKFRLSTPAGENRVANIAIAPLVTRNFEVVGRIIIVDDITERLELESQLTQAEKMSSIGLLAAGVAHEVNTPLAVISSYAQLLAKQLQGDDQRSALLEKITKQTFRASEIVNSLLNFSRTSGSEFQLLDLNKIIQDTLTLLDHQFKHSRVHVESDLYVDLPRVMGNSGKLQQVFLNLFLNAKDAMPQGGTIKVVTANGDGVRVMISDTGSGIAPEHILRIYDPFFTTKNHPRNGQHRGTGLGLSVSYGIIQEHAGKIQVNSRPGEGTTFALEFPMIRKAVNV
ncbi:MAG TPA: ATP-binding protein [Terriglobales bacterium]|nr:ATP-binding protein [Terriglobales bacterium]